MISYTTILSAYINLDTFPKHEEFEYQTFTDTSGFINDVV